MMKMCKIIKELRALQKYGDKSEQVMAKRILNGLYGEKHNEGIERITLLQYLKTFECSRVSLRIKETWNGMPCVLDLGHFNAVKDNTLFASIALVNDSNESFAPQELYNLYILKGERNPISITFQLELTNNPYFGTDSIKGETNGKSNN